MKHFIRFCKTKNVLMIPHLIAAYAIAAQHPYHLAVIGVVLGTIAYRCLERYFHEQMHVNPRSPFYTLHRLHHEDPTPETSVPEYWTFAFYFVTTIAVALAGRPIIAGIWCGVFNMIFWYEWIHFLCHCNYKPKTRYGWEIRINHLLHHNYDWDSHYEMLFPVEKRLGEK